MCKCKEGDWSVLKLTDNADFELKPAVLTQSVARCDLCGSVYQVERDVVGKVLGIKQIFLRWNKTSTAPQNIGGSA